VGGYWWGTCEYQGERDELLEMFLEGMMREVREDVGGLVTWVGFVAEMELQLSNVRYTRSMLNLANAVKAIFTRIGDNVLTNGGAESGAWTVYNGATVTQDTTWINTGTYSCKIVVADTTIRGARINGAGYSVTIVAGTQYEIAGIVKADSGSWRISCNRADTDASLAFDSTRGATGEKQIRMVIPATNTYAGTVDLRITSEASAGTIYGDSFTFQIAPYQAQTGWAINADSIAEFGRMETALLEVAMTSAAANAKVATELKKRAWAKTLPPSEFSVARAESQEDKLTLTLHGYAHTIGNKYSLTVGTAAASAHVNSILAECEFVSAGSVTSNTLSFQIDNRAPIRHFQILLDIIKAGDASGNRWVGGVYGGRMFDYGLADNVIAYRYGRQILQRGGR
jgi:hypothetical protein